MKFIQPCTLQILISLLAFYIFSINAVNGSCQNGQTACPLGTDDKPKSYPTSTSGSNSNNSSLTQPQQATRQRQAIVINDSSSNKNRKRPHKNQSEKFAAASLAAAYKQRLANSEKKKPQTPQQAPLFQKRKLFQFVEENNPLNVDDSNEPAAIPLQPNRVRQRLAQRVNVRTAAASNPQVRHLSLNPNFIDNFGNVNSSPNENPTSRFQRIVNSALTHSTPANSLLNNELLTPSNFNQRQPSSLPNPLVLDINSFTSNDAANLFGNQPSLLNEEHLINLDTPRRQFSRVKPNNALFNPLLNTLDFLGNPITTVQHNPPHNNRRQNNQSTRKPAQANNNNNNNNRIRSQSSPVFNNNEATLNPFLQTTPSRSVDFNNFNSYNVEPFISRLSAAEISANLPDLSIRIQPSSVVNAELNQPTASKRLVRVRRPNTSASLTTPSVPQTTPLNANQGGRRRVNVNRNKNELGTQGRGPVNNGLYLDEETNYGNNNAIDVDDILLNNKVNAQLEPSRISLSKEDSSVLVNYQTVFTYLTTVIKGQHTLFTSRMSTVSESSTKPVDDELSLQLEKGVVVQPTETMNLGTKTKGATTTIINVQSQVNVENFKALPPTLHITPTISPLDHNQLQPTRIKLLEKPEIVVDDVSSNNNNNNKQTPRLSLDQIKQAARVVQTEYRYIYTVYDNLNTRKSTRNEIVTNTLSQPLDLHNMEIDSTVDSNGFLRLGSANGELINLGKRIKSGSTTEVNLQLKTLAKLDGLANHRVEVTSSLIQPTYSSSIVEQPSSSATVALSSPVSPQSTSRLRSSLRVVSSRVSAVDSTQVQPSKSRLAVRIRKPIYSRVPGVSNRIVSSRVANSRLHPSSTSEQPHIEPTKSIEHSLPTDSVSSSGIISKTPALESSLSSLDLHSLSSTSSIQPTTPISSSHVDSSSKRRIVTVRKPLTNLNRLRTRRPPFVTSSPDLVSETEQSNTASSTLQNNLSTAKFSLYSRYTISHHHSSSSTPSSVSSVPSVSSVSSVFSSSSSNSIVASIQSSSKQYPRVRLTSSRVIKTKSSSVLDKSTSTVAAIQPSQIENINPSLSTIYSTATHTIPFTIGSKTLYTTFEITNSKVEKIDNLHSSPAHIEQPIPSSSIVLLSSANNNNNIQPTSSFSEMETRTMFTTFTYFTTFYQSGGQSKIVSSESTMSNIITVPVDMASPSIKGVSLSSSVLLPSESSYSSSIQPSSIQPIFITEHSEKTETSTILNTITYFATLYNGTKSTITPIEEVKTELLTLKEPIKITRTIHPLVGGSMYSTTSSNIQSSQQQTEQPRNVFVRTYYTTYTNPITMFNSDGPSVSNVEEVVSNIITFTLPGQKPSSVFNLPTTTTTSSIDFIKPTSVQSPRTIQTTLTHYITLYSGTNTILSSIEEVSTKTLSPNEMLPSSTRPIILSDANQLVPSISTLFRTHMLYTTLFNDGNPTIASKEHITSSLLTVYVPQSQINAQASSSPVPKFSSSSNSDILISPSYSLQDEIRPTSSIAIDEQILKTSTYLPEAEINLSSSFRDEIPIISSSIGDIASILDSSVLQSSTSKLPAIFDINVGGKSTTVIDGSTVVFFTDFIFPQSSTDPADIHSATETNHVAKGPAGDINLLVDNSAPFDDHRPKDPTKDESDLISKPIKPGQVIDLSDILGSSAIGGSLSDTIKDIVQLIAANTNKQMNNKDSKNNADAPVYLPNPPLYKDSVSSVYVENPVLSSDHIGVHQHQRPNIDNIAPSFGSDDSSSSIPTNPLQKSSIQEQQSDSTRAVMFDTVSEQPVSTKYLTSVESSTRTLTLTTTKVYYTRDSPLTITSILTTTIRPRTFVTTIIGSRTILGTAGEQTKTLDISDATQQLNNLQQTTTVTTTTLTFNSITTTVVRTLVLPSVAASNIQPSKTQAATISKIPATKLPTGAGSVTPTGSQTKRKPYIPNIKGPQRPSTTPATVKILPKDSKTRPPYKPKPPVASNVPPRFATPKPPKTVYTTTTTTTTTERPIERDQCRPACNTANKEICKEISGIFKCDCRPGFAKKTGSNICEEIQTYALLLRVTKLGDNLINYDDLEDESAPTLQLFKKQTKHQVDSAYRQSSIKDNYIGADINWINQTLNTDGVYVNLTLKLSQMEGVSESMLKEEFVKSLNEINVIAEKQRHQPVTDSMSEDDTHGNSINSLEKANRTASIVTIPASQNVTIQVNNSNGTQSKPILNSMLATVEALTDVDECGSNDLNDCGAGAVCVNSIGSYRCTCVDGFADLQPQLPGRVCSAELKDCDFCSGRGTCVRESNGNITCRCAKRYLGRNCEINGFMLTIMLPVTVIFAIITFCCVAYCCRKYRKRNNYSKGFKNMVNFTENNLSANISASTLDRKAMLETSSESSEHFRHVYDGPALLPDLSGSTRRARSEHMMDIANLMPPGSRSQLANMPGYGYNQTGNLNATNGQSAVQQQYAGGFGTTTTIPPQIVIPRARHPNQVNYSIHRGQVYMW